MSIPPSPRPLGGIPYFHDRRTRPALLLLPLCLLALTAPANVVRAQGPGQLELFASRQSASTSPLFAGMALTGYSGIFGIRASGAFDPNGSTTTASSQVTCSRRGFCQRTGSSYDGSFLPFSVAGWTADADLVIAPLRTLPVARALLLGFSPYAFAGIGGNNYQVSSGRDTTFATFSYGAGVQHQLLGWLGLDAEARYRRGLHSDSAIRVGSPRDWTYRVGFTVNFGGASSSAAHDGGPQLIVTSPPVPLVVAEAVESDDALSARAARVLDRAADQVGVPFRRGGRTPSDGFDAAGFVQYVMGAEGVAVPSSVQQLATTGKDVSTRVGALRPGDLLFFANDGATVDHVAIYVGHDRVIHATGSAGTVRYDVLGEGERGQWFADHLVSARRVLVSGAARVKAPAPPDHQGDPIDRAPRPNDVHD
ncbi:MAG: hypothetical protein JWN53_2240 [Gemmatimonadetes bacterium]|nr:hypothetical protein [Gemmatimonadota bacterium]